MVGAACQRSAATSAGRADGAVRAAGGRCARDGGERASWRRRSAPRRSRRVATPSTRRSRPRWRLPSHRGREPRRRRLRGGARRRRCQLRARFSRDRAPGGATRHVRRRAEGDGALSREGYLAVAVPGSVAGLYASCTTGLGATVGGGQSSYAIRLADEGFVVDNAFSGDGDPRQRRAPGALSGLGGAVSPRRQAAGGGDAVQPRSWRSCCAGSPPTGRKGSTPGRRRT